MISSSIEVTAMALTPEDVVNKRFQPTKFREGYDQDEVDDFLDEVVVELRRLNQENDELRQRLQTAESAQHEAPAAQAPAPVAAPEPEPAPVAAAAPAPVAVATPGVNPDDDTEGTSNLLQLARRLHEEHVREGVEKRDALIAEGHAQAARLVSDAESKQRQIVAEAEAQQRQIAASLEREKSQLEGKIDELRGFERDYRAQLKSYIQSQLAELDATSSQGSEQSSGFEPAPASAQGFGSN
jgi:DivIVA domain-containing protein